MIKYDVLLYDATHDYDQLYTYHHGTPLAIGERVLVPFGPKNVPREAVVFAASQHTSRTKPIIERLPVPPLNKQLIELFQAIHDYYVCPMGQLLRLALPMAVRMRPDIHYLDASDLSEISLESCSGRELDEKLASGEILRRYQYQPTTRLRTRRYLVTRALPEQLEAYQHKLPGKERKVRSAFDELSEAGEILLDGSFSEHHLALLMASGLTQIQERTIDPSISETGSLIQKLPELSTAQEAVRKSCGAAGNHLIQGPPASGKSLILMHLARQCVDQGKHFLWLVSDSVQAMQAHELLYQHFGEELSLMHAYQSRREVLHAHEQMVNGRSVGIIGTRNALFAPMRDIGIILIDDCHEDTFVSEEPDLDFRRAACFYGELLHVPVVMASSTPDLNQLSDNTLHKHYLKESFLPSDRTWQLIDLRDEPARSHAMLSDNVFAKLEHKSLVFLNRLGYAAAVICEQCLYIERCPDCQSTLFYERTRQRLQCRQCGFSKPFQTQCPSCAHALSLRGAGTETMEATLKQAFPEKRIERFDSIRLSRKADFLQTAQRIRQADLIITTSVLSGVGEIEGLEHVLFVAPDAALFLPEFRSAEKTFQHLMQIGGLVGREQHGEVSIQSHVPDNYVYQHAAKEQILPFLKHEYKLRKLHQLPPTVHLIRLVLQHEQAQQCLAFAEQLKKAIIRRFPYTCRGPYRPVYEKKGKYYEQDLLLSDVSEMQDVKQYLRGLVPRGSQRMRIIVDPLTIMY